MNEPIGLFYIDGDALEGHVQAGDSAERTIRAVVKQLTPAQRKAFVRWLEVGHKLAKQLDSDLEISAFRSGVEAEAKKGPPATYEVNGKTYKHQKKKPDLPDAGKSLLDIFGM